MKKQLALIFSLLLLFCSGCQPDVAPSSADTQHAALVVHFLDVGQADAALLECGGQTMLIDGGNVADSSFVVSYLAEQGIEKLDYVICTHAHEDHVGGLSGPLNTVTVETVYAPVTEYDTTAFGNFVKYTEAQGRSVQKPTLDVSFPLGGAEVTILGPRTDYTETNNTSIVLRVTHGTVSFLFTGDMERDAEQNLLAAGCDLSATVLKVGHHGSDTSTSYSFLREVMPAYAVISVGTDNTYGHPSDTVLSRLRDAGSTVYRTDLQGTIVATSDGSSVTFTTEKNSGVQTNPTQGEGSGQGEQTVTYIGNLKSKKFHLDTCPNLPASSNRILFDNYESAVEQGYAPCGTCLKGS